MEVLIPEVIQVSSFLTFSLKLEDAVCMEATEHYITESGKQYPVRLWHDHKVYIGDEI